MNEIGNLHCAMCERQEVFTIYRGDSLCHHCYEQMNKAQATVDKMNTEMRTSIREIRKRVKEMYNVLMDKDFVK